MSGAKDPVIVERATEDDFAQICAIDASTGLDRRNDLAAAVAARQCLVAREGEAYRGFAIVNQSFFGQYFIALLVVHPDHRRSGVASALIAHTEKICPADKIFTSVEESNTPMRALCERLGYRQSGMIENLSDEVEIIYCKYLQPR